MQAKLTVTTLREAFLGGSRWFGVFLAAGIAALIGKW